MARGFIFLVAAIYAALGLGFLLLPAPMSSGIDLAPRTATALTDVRATYGGFELGVAALLVVLSVVRRWLVPALLVVTFTVGGFAFGRTVGMLVDGIDGALHPAFLLLELSLIAVSALLLRRERPRMGAQPAGPSAGERLRRYGLAT